MNSLLLALDLTGTFVFALSGGLTGVRHRLDIFGVLVLAFAAGNAGGIARDVQIGAIPPPAISNWRYIAVSVLAGLITFWWHPKIARLRSAILVLDAGGLALFAVSGATKALNFHLSPIAAILLGMLTGIGGGMTRDVLVRETPGVLRSDLYAVAALAGAVVVVVGRQLGAPSIGSALAGAALCFGLRIAALQRGWNLPRAHAEPSAAAEPEPADQTTER